MGGDHPGDGDRCPDRRWSTPAWPKRMRMRARSGLLDGRCGIFFPALSGGMLLNCSNATAALILSYRRSSSYLSENSWISHSIRITHWSGKSSCIGGGCPVDSPQPTSRPRIGSGRGGSTVKMSGGARGKVRRGAEPDLTTGEARCGGCRTGPLPGEELRRSSAQIEPVQVHHLVPRRDEVGHELLGGTVGGVDLGHRA